MKTQIFIFLYYLLERVLSELCPIFASAAYRPKSALHSSSFLENFQSNHNTTLSSQIIKSAWHINKIRLHSTAQMAYKARTLSAWIRRPICYNFTNYMFHLIIRGYMIDMYWKFRAQLQLYDHLDLDQLDDSLKMGKTKNKNLLILGCDIINIFWMGFLFFVLFTNLSNMKLVGSLLFCKF